MFTTEIFQSRSSSWEEVKERVIFLEREAFENNAFPVEELTIDFLNENNIIVLLKNTELNEVVGFVYAKPIEDAEPSRSNEKGETAYLWDIVIKKEYRGRHLTGILMERIEEELKKMNYKYIDLCAVTANNFSDNISKVYKERIIKSESLDSKWGPQVFFRIKL